jgi:hypothetical protein
MEGWLQTRITRFAHAIPRSRRRGRIFPVEPLGGVKLVNIRCSRLTGAATLTVQHQLSTHTPVLLRVVSPLTHRAIRPPADPAARRFTCHRPQHPKILDPLSKELQKSSSLCSN